MLDEQQRKLVEDNLKLCHYALHRMGIHEGDRYDDCFQTACIGLCKAAKHYQPEKGEFSTYACLSIYRALAYDWKLEKRWNNINVLCLNKPIQVGLDEGNCDMEDQIPSLRTADEGLWKNEIWSAIETLPLRLKRVFVLYMQGQTLQEIGNSMGVTRERARQILSKAKEKIGRQLKAKGW